MWTKSDLFLSVCLYIALFVYMHVCLSRSLCLSPTVFRSRSLSFISLLRLSDCMFFYLCFWPVFSLPPFSHACTFSLCFRVCFLVAASFQLPLLCVNASHLCLFPSQVPPFCYLSIFSYFSIHNFFL